MAVQYATTRYTTTFTGDTKANICAGVEAALNAAGWSTISGHGTTDMVLQTGTTSQGYALRAHFKDNGGTCIQVSMVTTDGAKASTVGTAYGASLLPGVAKVWQIVANPYQFVLWVPGDSTVAREFCLFSCPYVPSFFLPMPQYIGILHTNTLSDSSTDDPQNNFRYSAVDWGQNAAPNFVCLFGTSIWENANNRWNNSNYPSMPLFVTPISAWGGNANVTAGSERFYRYQNGNLFSMDAMLAWGLTAFGDEPKVACQLWDALLICGPFAMDTVTAFDTHNWVCITDSNTSQTKVSLWIATS